MNRTVQRNLMALGSIVALALGLAPLGQAPAAAAVPSAASLEVCGQLTAYRPPAREAEGLITLKVNGADQTYFLSNGGLKGPSVAPDATIVGTRVCLNGNIAPSARPPAHEVVTDYTLARAVSSTSALPTTSTDRASGNDVAILGLALLTLVALGIAVQWTDTRTSRGT